MSWNAKVNIRHYNNKQHHSPTRGGESMACVGGSGQEWVGLREWDVCRDQVENNFRKLEKQKRIPVHIRYVRPIS